MLAQSAMIVVIALAEKIMLGTWEHVTAEPRPYRLISSLTCHRDELVGNY